MVPHAVIHAQNDI